MNRTMDAGQVRKLLGRLFGGMVVGAAISGLFFASIGKMPNFDDPSRIAAVGAGLIYALMGLIVGIGSLMPGFGAKFLNVEDAGEIVEERKSLAPGAIVSLLVGVVFLSLALAPSGDFEGAISRELAVAIAAISFAILLAASIWMMGRIDELNRALGRESSALAMNLVILLFGGWAVLTHFGYAEWISPLGLLSALALLQLGSVFWVIGKRGMLIPR